MTPRVKVCGICRLEDAELAIALGADAIGFVFWPDSPRYCEPDCAHAIAARLPAQITRVGVFVDQGVDQVVEIAEFVPLDAVQLHGSERLADFERVRQPLIKAVPVTEGLEPATVDRLPEEVTVLLDAHDPIRRGGTGRTRGRPPSASSTPSTRPATARSRCGRTCSPPSATARPWPPAGSTKWPRRRS